MRPNLAFGPIDSLTQYLLYLSVVVFGILLPLAIQRWAKRRQEKLLLEATRASLADEVAANRAKVEKSRDSFVALVVALEAEIAQYKALWAARHSGAAGATPDRPPPSDLPVAYATTIRTAWEIASIRQALALFPADELAAYSRAYQLQHALEQNRGALLDAVLRANALEGPTDLGDLRNVERRIEGLLALQSMSQYHAALSASLVDAFDGALKASS